MASDDDLNAWLHSRIGTTVRHRHPVGGGCIHQAWRLELADGRHLFAKTNAPDALPLLEAEADGLHALARVVEAGAGSPGGDGPVRRLIIPEPVAVGLLADQAVLLLPWLALEQGRGGDISWRGLGTCLADLHRRSLEVSCGSEDKRTAFGWGKDNFIGSGPQSNGWMEDWGRFFTERRLAPQLEELARKGDRLKGGRSLLERVPEWLGDHPASPCLVHGDLWSGNLSLLVDGGGALFDPAVHRADREVDLAMARLFGGVPEAFFQGYEERWPLPEGHRSRIPLYDLYHLLNHANLFGGGYRAQAQATITALLRQGGA